MYISPEERVKITKDINWLVNNPGGSMGTYHDASSCWKLIFVLLEYIRYIKGILDGYERNNTL